MLDAIQVLIEIAYVKLLTPIADDVGDITPNVFIPTPVNTPPLGVTDTWYGSILSHKLGIAVIVGVGGLIANTFIVSVRGQLIIVGVTTTV